MRSSKKVLVAINIVKHYFFRFIFLILICNNIYAKDKIYNEIKSAGNLIELEHILKDCSPDCLVVWDVDEVLITPTDRIFHTKNCTNNLPSKYAKAAMAKYAVSKKQAQWNGSKMLLQRNMKLVAEGLVLTIRALQNHKVKTIALTKFYTGTYGAIASLENFRIKQLKKVGINFNRAFPQHGMLVLDNVKNAAAKYPIFKNGILFTNEYTKGEVLEAFLSKINWQPKKIIFIDDLKEHLVSVQHVLQNKNISYTGILYTAADKLPSEIDEDIVKMQYEVLIKREIWLNDYEAEKLLKTN